MGSSLTLLIAPLKTRRRKETITIVEQTRCNTLFLSSSLLLLLSFLFFYYSFLHSSYIFTSSLQVHSSDRTVLGDVTRFIAVVTNFFTWARRALLRQMTEFTTRVTLGSTLQAILCHVVWSTASVAGNLRSATTSTAKSALLWLGAFS